MGVGGFEDVIVDDSCCNVRVLGCINCCCNVIKLSSSSEIWMVSGELLCDLSE